MGELGESINDWQAPPTPTRESRHGLHCYLEPLNPERQNNSHVQDLWDAYAQESNIALWQYLPYGPFDSLEEFHCFIISKATEANTIFYAVIDKRTGKAIGFIAYSRIQEDAGSIEIAHVCFSPKLQKTIMATEAVYLLIDYAFSLGYRRCEWKCNALHQGSKKAGERFGFQYEGCFRQAMVVKGHNRDTSWFSIIDGEWPKLKAGYLAWLDPNNFDADFQQKNSLTYYLTRSV
jgi:RimJ/RimL family protein N-acetyltransferase